MKVLKNPGSVALPVGILLVLAAGWLYLSALTSASMRCVPCDCSYDLRAADSYCRPPAVLARLSVATLVGSTASFAAAWIRRRQARLRAGGGTV
jgi:hypothetical protein